MLTKIEIRQFESLLKALYKIDEDLEVFLSGHVKEVKTILALFYRDLFEAKYGYPNYKTPDVPYIEDMLEAFMLKYFKGTLSLRGSSPQICLSHDVDYIYPTFVQNLKRVIGRRELKLNLDKSAYLDSLEFYLAHDASITRGSQESTLFVATPFHSKKPMARLKQWIIDPSYNETDSEFTRFLQLIEKYQPAIGIHGSILSHEEEHGFLIEAKENSRIFKNDLILSRQHWLHIPNREAFSNMHTAGIKIDSTLGWNGVNGFRGGMARPYKLFVSEYQYIWEVPLVVMDGVLFDELKLNDQQALEASIKILSEVYKRNGAVSINWHERTAAHDYKWEKSYIQLTEWAKAFGFSFTGFSHLIEKLNNEN